MCKFDRVYVDPVQRRARWKLVVVGARKKLNNGRRAAKLERRRSAKTAKKTQKNTEIDRKVIQQNTKQKLEWRRRGIRKRDGGTKSMDIK
jgi:hypothetical protein